MKFLMLIQMMIVTSITAAQIYKQNEPLAHTYSIVARDSATGEMGVAVQSHWFSVGTVVSWAEAGTGAIATQSFANKSFGIRGLELLKSGMNSKEVLQKLIGEDSARDLRQLAIIDKNGEVAVHTGAKCIDYANHITGNNYSVQANMMLTNGVPQAMSQAFEKNKTRPLAERMLLALEAAQKAGGDIRGKQSAAILVVPGKSSNQPWDERTVDLRVDDHEEPLKEIRRLYNVHLAYQHMNNGDILVEKNDMASAMKEYTSAMKMFPQNLEMQYWTAITLLNNKQNAKALNLLKDIFSKDKNWKELTRRLPKAGLLNVNADAYKKIMGL